jgi:hypothetical protein
MIVHVRYRWRSGADKTTTLSLFAHHVSTLRIENLLIKKELDCSRQTSPSNDKLRTPMVVQSKRVMIYSARPSRLIDLVLNSLQIFQVQLKASFNVVIVLVSLFDIEAYNTFL